MADPAGLVLIGFMGAGKSTLGDLLARRQGLPFVDLDAVIEAEAGDTIATLFEREGEASFRQREGDALRDQLASAPSILSTGGGVVEDRQNRRVLRDGWPVVWLDIQFETVRGRLQGREADLRPLVARLGWDGLQRLHRRRRLLYARCADFRFDSDRDSPAQMVRRLAVALAGQEGEAP